MRTLAAVLAAFPLAALAQQQQVVKPPIAVYWMSAETAAGFSMPGMPAMAAGMMGGPGGRGAQSGRHLVLQLGSQQSASGAPQAAHDIPPGMNMGSTLPLVTPQRATAPRGERDLPDGLEKPRGRMLIYWGCGETLRAGQPVVIDFAGLAEGKSPPNLVSRRIALPAGPAPGRSRTYGDWPNAEQPRPVPADASLRGEHLVKGNYSPEIRFLLERDFLARVELTANGNRLRWNEIAGATGYFATLMGAQNENEIVFWSSSEVQEMGGALMDYLPPSEVARLLREKVVLPPQVVECTVPGEVVKKAGTPMLSFIAYGEEANFAQPPRPQDPKIPWEPRWAAKVRFKSTASLLMGEEAARQEARPERRQEAPAPQATPAAPDPLKEGINVIRGIFGR